MPHYINVNRRRVNLFAQVSCQVSASLYLVEVNRIKNSSEEELAVRSAIAMNNERKKI